MAVGVRAYGFLGRIRLGESSSSGGDGSEPLRGVPDGTGYLYWGVPRGPSRLKELRNRDGIRGLSPCRPEPAPSRRDYSSPIWTPRLAPHALPLPASHRPLESERQNPRTAWCSRRNCPLGGYLRRRGARRLTPRLGETSRARVSDDQPALWPTLPDRRTANAVDRPYDERIRQLNPSASGGGSSRRGERRRPP
jgi:hypothetical protein